MANYGGELYTVKWESDILLTMSDSVQKIVHNLAESAGKEILKKMALSTLMYASALPLAIYTQIDNINGEWVFITGRSREAGKELAKSLLANTKSDHRPVMLVGYLFGALVIYSCLLELARYQEEWLERQEDVMTVGSVRSTENNTTDVPPSLNQTKEKQKIKKEKEKKNENDQLDFECEPASIIEDVVFMGLPKYLD